MGQSNQVTVYQNGIAAFERQFDIGSETRQLSLTFKTEHLADVLGTLNILGDVRVVEPPNYAPEKQKPTLTINPASVTKDLAKSLSGAEVRVVLSGAVGETLTGELVGTETTKSIVNGTVVDQDYLTVQTKDGFRRLNLASDVASFAFTSEAINAEIAKALNYNLEQIKPGSTFVYVGLKANGKATTAALRYAIPTPAWKFSYRARQTTRGWNLDGYAVVDNNTDEDWTDFDLRVATGQPITFGTDLAAIRTPQRSSVNLVSDRVQGAVEADGGFESCLESTGRGMAKMNRRANAAPMAAACFAGGGAESVCDDATQPMAEVSEVGDFSVFHAEMPVTIQAHRSGLVKIFSVPLKDADLVLYYNQSQNAQRAMRAVQLTNDAKFTLGRGVCAVEEDNTHVGSAVLPLTKAGEPLMLCHAVETGVKAKADLSRLKTTVSNLRLSKGVLITETTNTVTTTYTFSNVRDERFKVVVDHGRNLSNSAVAYTVNGEPGRAALKELNGLSRLQLTLQPKESVVVKVIETRLDKQRLEGNGVLTWVQNNPSSALLKTPEMSKVIDLQTEIDKVARQITVSQTTVDRLTREQDRLRKNLDALGTGPDANSARSRLLTCETEIGTQERDNLPRLELRQQELIAALGSLLAGLTANWTEK